MAVHQQIAHPSTSTHPLPTSTPPYHPRPPSHTCLPCSYPALPLFSPFPLSTAHVAKNDKGRICDANLRHADGRYFAMQVRRREEKEPHCTAVVVVYGVVYYGVYCVVYYVVYCALCTVYCVLVPKKNRCVFVYTLSSYSSTDLVFHTHTLSPLSTRSRMSSTSFWSATTVRRGGCLPFSAVTGLPRRPRPTR